MPHTLSVAALAALASLAAMTGAETFQDAPVRAYVVSMPGTRSRPAVRARFSGQQQPITFFDGVDGAALAPHPRLSPGEVGCAWSHMEIWKNLVQGTQDVLVFEDDAVPSPNFQSRLREVRRAIRGRDVDIVFLGHCLETKGAAWRGSATLRESVRPLCTHAYLVTPRGGVKLAGWAAHGRVDDPIDVELAAMCKNGTLTCLSCYPPLATTTRETSIIHGAM